MGRTGDCPETIVPAQIRKTRARWSGRSASLVINLRAQLDVAPQLHERRQLPVRAESGVERTDARPVHQIENVEIAHQAPCAEPESFGKSEIERLLTRAIHRARLHQCDVDGSVGPRGEIAAER